MCWLNACYAALMAACFMYDVSPWGLFRWLLHPPIAYHAHLLTYHLFYKWLATAINAIILINTRDSPCRVQLLGKITAKNKGKAESRPKCTSEALLFVKVGQKKYYIKGQVNRNACLKMTQCADITRLIWANVRDGSPCFLLLHYFLFVASPCVSF